MTSAGTYATGIPQAMTIAFAKGPMEPGWSMIIAGEPCRLAVTKRSRVSA